jgi:hypothetical protein
MLAAFVCGWRFGVEYTENPIFEVRQNFFATFGA